MILIEMLSVGFPTGHSLESYGDEVKAQGNELSKIISINLLSRVFSLVKLELSGDFPIFDLDIDLMNFMNLAENVK